MRKREEVSRAAARILQTFLSPVSGRVTFGPCEKQVEWASSQRLGLRTKYYRVIVK